MKKPHPGGRPPKAPEDRRDAKVEVLLLDEEKDMLEAAAQVGGTSMAAILRDGGLALAREMVAARKGRKR